MCLTRLCFFVIDHFWWIDDRGWFLIGLMMLMLYLPVSYTVRPPPRNHCQSKVMVGIDTYDIFSSWMGG